MFDYKTGRCIQEGTFLTFVNLVYVYCTVKPDLSIYMWTVGCKPQKKAFWNIKSKRDCVKISEYFHSRWKWNLSDMKKMKRKKPKS